jgi:large subunit ribosomal protein L25
VLYGAGIEAVPIELSYKEALKPLGGASGATLFDLQLDKETHKVLVREIQRDVLTRRPIHVDFLKVAMDKLIRAEVPIELVGEAPAVKTLGGILVTGLNTVEVEALPADLPDRLVVNLDVLATIDASITVKDLTVGEGVEVLSGPDELIARVIYEAAEEEPTEAVAVPVEAEEPEVIGRGKKEEEEEGEGEEE